MAKRFDWIEALNLRRAVASTKSEMFGDWVRDPWSWPELSYLGANPEPLLDRLNDRRTRFERISVPKINYGTRPASLQSPVDRLAYHAVVNAASARIAGDLAPFVMGWRLNRTAVEAGRFADNQQEWLGFIANRREATEQFDSVLTTDITNFFGSIDSNRLRELVYRRAGKTAMTEAIDWMLEAFNQLPDRSGIPQRSTASSLLANAYLHPIDDILKRYTNTTSRALRWMDDIWVFGGGHEQLRCLQLDLQDELRNIGLEINLGKTQIREGPDVRELIESIDLERDPPARDMAVSGAPFVAIHHQSDLDNQLERLLARPERLDRTTIRYVCVRVREFDRIDLIPQLLDITPRAPQGVDHFARLFAKSGFWRELSDWYVDQARRPVGLERLPWPIAQLGTMFPSDEPVHPVADLFAESLERNKNPSIELLAVAAHRLSTWRPADARVLLRSIGGESESPLCRRIAAIALHNLRESPSRIRQMLNEFEENKATRLLLEQYGNTKVPENRDFDPALT